MTGQILIAPIAIVAGVLAIVTGVLLMRRARRQTRLQREVTGWALAEAMRKVTGEDADATREPQARPGRWCRDCGNRIGSAACAKACGGAS